MSAPLAPVSRPQSLRKGLLVALGEDCLTVGAEAVGVRGGAHTTLLAAVRDERLGHELFQVMADRVGGNAELRAQLGRRARLRALQLEQDIAPKSFVDSELR